MSSNVLFTIVHSSHFFYNLRPYHNFNSHPESMANFCSLCFWLHMAVAPSGFILVTKGQMFYSCNSIIICSTDFSSKSMRYGNLVYSEYTGRLNIDQNVIFLLSLYSTFSFYNSYRFCMYMVYITSLL